jgi:hypothetical protein
MRGIALAMTWRSAAMARLSSARTSTEAASTAASSRCRATLGGLRWTRHTSTGPPARALVAPTSTGAEWIRRSSGSQMAPSSLRSIPHVSTGATAPESGTRTWTARNPRQDSSPTRTSTGSRSTALTSTGRTSARSRSGARRARSVAPISTAPGGRAFFTPSPTLAQAGLTTPGGVLTGGLTIRSSGGVGSGPSTECGGHRYHSYNRGARIIGGQVIATFDSVGKWVFGRNLTVVGMTGYRRVS